MQQEAIFEELHSDKLIVHHLHSTKWETDKVGQHRWESAVLCSVPHVMIIVVSGERQIHLDPF